jgi:hypothetical protein
MAANINCPVINRKPARLTSPKTQPVLKLGILELLANGDMRVGTKLISQRHGLLGLDIGNGARADKAPGLGQCLRVTYANGRVVELLFVRKHQRWFDATKKYGAIILGVRPSANKVGWYQKFVANLLSRTWSWNEWRPASHPYSFLNFGSDGAVTVLSMPCVPGTPVALPNGWTGVFSGLDFCLHETDGTVMERFRYEKANRSWNRLVSCRRIAHSECLLGASVDNSGALVFEHVGVPVVAIGAGEPFIMHLGQKCLVRASSDSTLFLYDKSSQHVREFFIANNRLYEQAGAKETWIYTLLGCPGGQNRRRSIEVMPGAITLCDTGTVLALGRCYLPDEPIFICNPTVRVERAAGVGQVLCVSTATSIIGYVYGADQEWWLGSPRVPDRQFLSLKRSAAVDDFVTFGFEWLNSFIASAPGIYLVDRFLSSVSRTINGLLSQPLLLHFGIFTALLLAYGWYITFVASRVIALPWAAGWRAFRHVRRAAELTTT